jgi:hypothetical protein
MSSTVNRLVAIAVGAAGLLSAVPLISPGTATADPRGGVPCLGLVHRLPPIQASFPSRCKTPLCR